MSKYYSLYNDAKLRQGGRTIAKMSEKQFAEKAKKFILDACKDDSWIKEKLENTEAINRIIQYLPRAIRTIILNDHKGDSSKVTTTIGKDFKGIRPDWENHDLYGGLRTVKGAPYVIMHVGGDWECPVAVFIYHDGKEFRCYIPNKGNVYREDLKICFGNLDADYDSNTKTYNDMIKSTKYKKEVPSDDKYAFDLLCKDGTLDKEKDKDKMRGLGRSLEPDYDKCIEDFTARVDVKPLKESRNQELYNKIMLSVAKIVKRKLDEAVFISNDDDLLDDSDEVSNKIQDMVCKKRR